MRKSPIQYVIPDLETEMKESKKRRIVLFSTEKDRGKRYSELPFITEDEVIISKVTHEIRHRLQEKPEIKLFSPDLRFKDPYFNALKEFLKRYMERNPPVGTGSYEEEFDARFIQYYIQEQWHRGVTDLDKIARMVICNPQKNY